MRAGGSTFRGRAPVTSWPRVAAWLDGFAGWLRGRRQAAAASRPPPLVRLAAQPLTPRVSVHSLRWGEEELLLACTDGTAVLIARRPAPAADGVPE